MGGKGSSAVAGDDWNVNIARTLAVRAVTLFGVLVAVLVLLVVSLGATGYSDRLLSAQVNEELRGFRQAQAQTIKDPAQLEAAVAQRKTELTAFYWAGLSRGGGGCPRRSGGY